MGKLSDEDIAWENYLDKYVDLDLSRSYISTGAPVQNYYFKLSRNRMNQLRELCLKWGLSFDTESLEMKNWCFSLTMTETRELPAAEIRGRFHAIENGIRKIDSHLRTVTMVEEGVTHCLYVNLNRRPPPLTDFDIGQFQSMIQQMYDRKVFD